MNKNNFFIISIVIFIFLLSNLLVAKIDFNFDNKTNLIFFYQQGCPDCSKMHEILEDVETDYNIDIKMFDTRNPENIKLLQKLAEKYDSPMGIPIVFVGNHYLQEANEELLIQYTEDAIATDAPSPLEGIEYNDSNIRKVTLPAVLGAAAVDAFNPCACAVLALLLGTILLGSKSKKKVLGAGLAFTAATFISYTLMGLGLLKAIRISGVQQYIYLGASILAIILGLVNMKDYFNAKDKFNIEVPDSWKPKLKKMTSGISSIPGAFGTGFLISIFLLPCTSGPYIVIIGMLGDQATRLEAIFLLIIYNLIFVIPFIIITLGVSLGFTTTARVENWRKKREGKFHLATGIAMVALGCFMLVYFVKA